MLISIWNKFNKVGRKQPNLSSSRELAFVPTVITFLLQDHDIADIERQFETGVGRIFCYATVALWRSNRAGRTFECRIETAGFPVVGFKLSILKIL